MNYLTNQTVISKTLTQWSAPQEASCMLLHFLLFSGVFHARRLTADTWHMNGSSFTAMEAATLGTVTLPLLVLLTKRFHSSMSPLSIPTARNPWFISRSRPNHERAVTLLLNGGKVRICLTDLFSTAHIFTVLSLEPVANSWPNGFQEHDHIILLWASCLAKSW